MEETPTPKQDKNALPNISVPDNGTPMVEEPRESAPVRILEMLRGTHQENAPAIEISHGDKEPQRPAAAAALPVSENAPEVVLTPAPAPSSPTFSTIEEALGATGGSGALRGSSGIPQESAPIETPSFVANAESVAELQHGTDESSVSLPKQSKKEPILKDAALDEDAEGPEQKQAPRIAAMRTLRDDMKDIVENKNMSLVHAGALEEVRRQARKKGERASAESSTGRPVRRGGGSRGLLIASFILLALGGIALGAFFFYRSLQQGPLAKISDFPSLIFTEQTITLPLERSSPAILKATLTQARAESFGSPGSILRLLPTIAATSSLGSAPSEPRIADAREFFSALGTTLPPELSAALGADFFLGLQAGDGNQPVLILTVNSYERAFAGMLAWESGLSAALSPPFNRVPTTVQAMDGSLAGNTFEDVVIRNYDVRLLSHPDGTPGLLYAFPNRTTLIITSSPYTLIEALSRLQAARSL